MLRMTSASVVGLAFCLAFAAPAVAQENSMPQRDASSDSTFFRDRIDLYIDLWSKGPDDPFRLELADSLYLDADAFTSIDTDMYAVSDSLPTRTQTYDAFRPMWPDVWAGIAEGGLQTIYNFEAERNEGWALVTFDAYGEGTSVTGNPFTLFKNFTQLWTLTPDGWRIRHEHVSDGRGEGHGGSQEGHALPSGNR